MNYRKIFEDFSTKSKPYLIALRPWSLHVSFIPVILGTTLAYKDTGHFSLVLFVLSGIVVLSVHAAGNLVNTYYDEIREIDLSRNNGDSVNNKKKKKHHKELLRNNTTTNPRTLAVINANKDLTREKDDVDGNRNGYEEGNFTFSTNKKSTSQLTLREIANLGTACYIIGCLSIPLTLYISPAQMEHLALVFFGGFSSSFLYSGGLSLKYIGLGDLLVFLTFGPVAVTFAYLTQCGILSYRPLLYALPLALNTVTIFHSNNVQKIDAHTKAGIRTMAIILGPMGCYVLQVLLLLLPYFMIGILTFRYHKVFIIPLITVIFIFDIERNFRAEKFCKVASQTAKLHLVFGLTYALACFFLPDKFQLLPRD